MDPMAQETRPSLGRQLCGDFTTATAYEWLVTNGIGGYACGTIAGANTRRYHGLLIASLAPPVARMLLVAKLDLELIYRGRTHELGTNEFSGGSVVPAGYRYIESFTVQDGIPTWVYACDGALVQQQVFMAPGANCTYLKIELLRASEPMRVRLRPFLAYRDYHSQSRGPLAFRIDADAAACRIQAFDGARPFRLEASHGNFTVAPSMYWNFWHRAEAERGLDAVEDLFFPGSFDATLEPGTPLFITASAESGPPRDGAEVLHLLRAQAKALCTSLPRSSPAWVRTLALASNQFIVERRGEDGGTMSSIIAGYPWFTDWGRDTMIALPGIATALRRFDIASNILRSYARYIDGGMLPNCFPDSGASPQYNTADATLWMFHAVDDYLHATRDPALLKDLFPLLINIIRAHDRGTRFGIGVDPVDGLLRAGEPGSQLTWMDAKSGDHTFTPRIGKPVEINALWVNALDVAVRLASRVRAISERNYCQALLSRAATSFARFWNEDRGCLYDVLDVDGTSEADTRIRPNQILAIALPFCPLNAGQMRSTVDVCTRELITSYGLRSLGAQEPGYIGRYMGDAWQRDGAYHMGTVWTWLLGPFTRAHFRVYGDPRRAQSFLAPLQLHLNEACIGSIGEIFDGDAPHSARGCFAQAWSVAEILRSWLYLERRISTN
jgi:predicted glycogen debranching enzyme